MKLFLAPLQGMTIACYRNAFSRIFGGIDAYYSPFIATADLNKISTAVLKDLLPENNDPSIPLVPQLLSNNGTDFKAFASAISGLGYSEINWNIGCPFPMVTNKKKGSGILPYPEMVRSFLDTVCTDSSYQLTVKMRLGLNNPEEGIKIIDVLNDYPLGGVMLHARTGSQMYAGSVDLEAFHTLAAACRHQITYNGDIFTVSDYQNIHRRFPEIHSFMLGRGALRDPFLPSAISGQVVVAEKKLSMIRQLHNEIFNYYKSILSGDKHLCDKMKEFWTYLSMSIDPSGKFMKKIKKCHSAAAYLEVVNHVLDTP